MKALLIQMNNCIDPVKNLHIVAHFYPQGSSKKPVKNFSRLASSLIFP